MSEEPRGVNRAFEPMTEIETALEEQQKFWFWFHVSGGPGDGYHGNQAVPTKLKRIKIGNKIDRTLKENAHFVNAETLKQYSKTLTTLDALPELYNII